MLDDTKLYVVRVLEGQCMSTLRVTERYDWDQWMYFVGETDS